jgi:hypothetical protein
VIAFEEMFPAKNLYAFGFSYEVKGDKIRSTPSFGGASKAVGPMSQDFMAC